MGQDKKGPGILRKAVNFTKATAKHVSTGSKHVSLEVIQERFDICSNCPSRLFATLVPECIPINSLKEVKGVGICLHTDCGCFIHPTENFPNKLAWASQECPKKHWSSE